VYFVGQKVQVGEGAPADVIAFIFVHFLLSKMPRRTLGGIV
jgi:hypothetical protein